MMASGNHSDVRKKIARPFTSSMLEFFFIRTVKSSAKKREFLLQITSVAEFDKTIAVPLLSVAFIFFVVAHGIRLYVTLAMLEERHAPFEGFLDDASPVTCQLEFAARVLIVLIVTGKAVGQWTEFKDVCMYLSVLYLAMFLWSLVAYFGIKRVWSEAYGTVAFFGFLGVLALGIVSENGFQQEFLSFINYMGVSPQATERTRGFLQGTSVVPSIILFCFCLGIGKSLKSDYKEKQR